MDIGRRIRAPLVDLCRRWRLTFDEERLRAECRRVLMEAELNRSQGRVPEQLPGLRGADLWAWMLDRVFADRDGARRVNLCVGFVPERIAARKGVRKFARAIMQALFETCDVGCSGEEVDGLEREVQCGCARRDARGAMSTFWVKYSAEGITIERGAADIDMS
jgi:hypothetical protein